MAIDRELIKSLRREHGKIYSTKYQGKSYVFRALNVGELELITFKASPQHEEQVVEEAAFLLGALAAGRDLAARGPAPHHEVAEAAVLGVADLPEDEDELLDDILADDAETDQSEPVAGPIDRAKLKEEIELLERLSARDERLRARWREAAERRRQLVNQDLRRNLWILGSIGSAAPFIGLFGTVIGILRSFGEMAKTGAGGFAVVAGGISESLIATAAGIIVAVISVMAYNIFQTRSGSLVLMIRLQVEEFVELISGSAGENGA